MTPNAPFRSLLFVGLVVVSVVAGVGIVSAGGDNGPTTTINTTSTTANTTATGTQNGTTMAGITESASIMADPNTANVTATHTINVTIGNRSVGTLTGMVVDYTGTNASVSLAVANVETVTLSGRNICNTTIPSSLNGETVAFTFGSHPHLESGDTLSVVYGGVENPPKASNYTIGVRINPTHNSTNLTAHLNIFGNGASTETRVGVSNNTTDTTATTEAGGVTGGEGATEVKNATATTTGSGPGFTMVVTVVCLLTAGFGITRRIRT